MIDTNIANTYGHDHDELDGYLRKFQEQKRSDFAAAKECFRQFKFGLQRHILWEEEILFPVFEQKTGMADQGPTAVMRREHRQIEELLEQLHKKVQRRDPESDAEEQQLIAVLEQHNAKEEQVLYPAVDGMTSGTERDDIFARMQQVPTQRYMTCGCGHDAPAGVKDGGE